jgi:VIT1/CCC1 family predicted Fe2+/Mn2+ transporter
MQRISAHSEIHLVHRIGWLRAAVLGANDGIISTASLIVGVASAAVGHNEILIAGVAGMVAGAMSMAAGEYVSVSSQSDAETADLTKEKRELERNAEPELEELTKIYMARGVEETLAREVAKQMTAKDALGTHAREELGISEITTARPVQAAITSGITFTVGAAMPLLTAILCPLDWVVPAVAGATIMALVVLGALGAYAGGAGILKPTVRVVFWGAFAMLMTAGIGKLFGVAV